MSNIVGTFPAGVKPLGYQQLTVDDTTGGVALTVPVNSKRAVIHVEAQPIRWTDDGTPPTTNLGVLAKADTNFNLYGSVSLKQFRAIKDDSSNATLSICFYG